MKHQKYLLLLIFCLSLLIRTLSVNWDSGFHLHPDERFLSMVAENISFPQNPLDYFNTATSTLNPINHRDSPFFVYGTLPLFLVKTIASLLHLDSYQSTYLIGRMISAFVDSLNIFLLFLVSKLIISQKSKLVYLASFIYSILVLPIQLSHFFTVDTFLNTLLFATFTCLAYWVFKNQSKYFYLSALLYGLAFAVKISSILFSPVIAIFFIYYFWQHKKINLFYPFIFTLIALVIFRIFLPYAFSGLITFNPKFIANLKELSGILYNRIPSYPPAIQYQSKTPIIYPLISLIVWGLGLPFFFYLIFNLKKIFSNFIIKLSLFWIIFLIIVQGSQFSIPLRYFLPIYPFIALIIGYLYYRSSSKYLFLFVLALQSIYLLAFLNIYLHPHSRVQASEWIFKNIAPASTIATELWDDPLPLDVNRQSSRIYQFQELSLYDPDTTQKMETLSHNLKKSDYISLSSNRLWSSIPPLPQRYPLTSVYYQKLFDHQLDFEKTISFHSYPGFEISFLNKCYYFGPSNYPTHLNKNTWFSIQSSCNHPGIYFRDDTAEESFTVYDHPSVIIFQKK